MAALVFTLSKSSYSLHFMDIYYILYMLLCTIALKVEARGWKNGSVCNALAPRGWRLDFMLQEFL